MGASQPEMEEATRYVNDLRLLIRSPESKPPASRVEPAIMVNSQQDIPSANGNSGAFECKVPLVITLGNGIDADSVQRNIATDVEAALNPQEVVLERVVPIVREDTDAAVVSAVLTIRGDRPEQVWMQMRWQLLHRGSKLLRGVVTQYIDRVLSASALLESEGRAKQHASPSARKVIFKELYKGWGSEAGCRLGAHERNKQPASPSTPYCEVSYATMQELISAAAYLAHDKEKMKWSDHNFYDIRCQMGKSVAVAALTECFANCTGIESMRALYQVADQRFSALEQTDWGRKNARSQSGVAVDLIHADPRRELCWIDQASVVFAATYGLEPAEYATLCTLAQRLRNGAVVITATKPLFLACFSMLAQFKGSMNWGETTFYLQRKV